MLARPILLLSALSGIAFALPSNYKRGPGGLLTVREFGGEDFDESDLFKSCPGGPGSSKLERADRCTLVNDSIIHACVVISPMLEFRSTSQRAPSVSSLWWATLS